MKIYLAGNVIVKERERRLAKLYRQRLASYFFVRAGSLESDAFGVIKEVMYENLSCRRIFRHEQCREREE